MLKGQAIDTTIKTVSIKDYLNGSVTISATPVIIDPKSYLKRVKVYDKDQNWVGTKPLIIDGLESLTVFLTPFKEPILDIMLYIKPNLDIILIIKPNLDIIL